MTPPVPRPLRPRASISAALVAVGLSGSALTPGCNLSDPSGVHLTIVMPVDGAEFTSRDDVDPKLAGTQIEVLVTAQGIARDRVIELVRTQYGEPVTPSLATASVQDRVALFRAFTLQPGQNLLQARLKDTPLTSATVTVMYRDTCGKIAFVEPSASDVTAGALDLGPSDDLDAAPCGDAFTTRFIASTGLGDGSEVALIVNGEASALTTTSGGVAVFERVVLPRLGESANRIAIQVLESDCAPAELDADVFVHCQGPPCSLGGPVGPGLSAADDEDPLGAGLQVSFEVATDASVSAVQLLINGDVDNARAEEATGGTVRFSAVSLPEGRGVRVKAICTRSRGARSTDEHLFNVDSTPCSVAITSPLARTAFAAPQPSASQPPASSLDIPVAASVGSDCIGVRAAALRSAECLGIDQVGSHALAAGQRTFSAPVRLSVQGDAFVCVQVTDAAGNTSQTDAQVSFDKQPPLLAITTPAGPWTLKPEDDLNDNTVECDVPITVSCDEIAVLVQLMTAADEVVLATATCSPDGVASFASVPLPSMNDGSSYDILARASDALGLVGSSAPRSITADCEP